MNELLPKHFDTLRGDDAASDQDKLSAVSASLGIDITRFERVGSPTPGRNPTWHLWIGGKCVTLSTKDLITQRSFRARVVNECGIAPRRIDDRAGLTWQGHVQALLDVAIEIDLEVQSEPC